MSKTEQREFYALSPEKAMNLWPKSFDFINGALPPANGNLLERKERIQESLLKGELILWLGLKNTDFVIMVTTTENTDPISGDKELLVYSMTLTQELTPGDLRFGMEKLKAYAKSQGLSKVTAYTGVDFIKKLFESQGAETLYTMKMEV